MTTVPMTIINRSITYNYLFWEIKIKKIESKANSLETAYKIYSLLNAYVELSF